VWALGSQNGNSGEDPVRNLDLLRACAVLLVAGAHLLGTGLHLYDRGYTFPHSMGRLGVMIFFVHTSLVLMMSLERGGARPTGKLVGSFYLRRAFRIYPLSILTVLGVTLLHIPPDPDTAFHNPSAFTLISNLTLTQNITHAWSVTGPLWSLPWEVQMYLALPFLFILVRNRRLKLLGSIAGIVVLANIIGVSEGYKAFRLFDYFPCFMGGVVAYLLLRLPRLFRLSGNLWPLVLFALLGGYLWSGIGWPVRQVFYSEWAVCLVLALLIPLFGDMNPGFATAGAHLVAKYSYGIYLFHYPALWLAFDRLGWLGTPLSTALYVLTTIATSVTLYHLVEDPMIEFGKWLLVPSERGKKALVTVATPVPVEQESL
jgi:peptidoglycan/LPS O-acetylase OafA/YrhL